MNYQSKQLPPGWSLTRIGDFTAEKVIQIKPAPPFNYIDISSINNTTKTIESPKHLTSSDTVPSRARQQLKPDDILVSMTRPNLNAVAQVLEEFDGSIASTGFHVLRPLIVSSNWLFAYVRSKDFIDSLVAQVQGALYPAIRPDDIRSHEIALPPLREQRRIVAKIQSLQERSTRARAALAEVGPLLEQFRRSVLSAAFSGRLTADWRAANPDIEPASELLHRIRTEIGDIRTRRSVPNFVSFPDDSQLPRFPDSWHFASTGTLLHCGALIDVKDGNHGANHPKSSDFTTTGVPFITAAQVRKYAIDYVGAPHVSGEPLHRIRVGFAKAGDVVLTHKGTVGRTAVTDRECVLTPQTTYYRCRKACLLPNYLMYYMSSPVFQQQLTAVMSQTTRNFVPISEQYKLFLLVPPLEEQIEITRLVGASMEQIQKLEGLATQAKLETTQLDQSILAKAFRGELVPQDPSDEPAAELLARIAAARTAAPTKLNKRTGRPAKQ